VRCETCGRPLTGSWSKGRNGRYAYNHCPRRCRAIYVSKAALEGAFVDELALLQPTPGYMRVVKDRVLYVWEQECAAARERTAEQERRLKAVRLKLDRLDEAFLYSESIDLETYGLQRDKLREELTFSKIDYHTEAVEEVDVEGIASCGLCGGGLVVETSSRKGGRLPEYVCHRHRHNGTCPNGLRMPLAEMNDAVLQAIEEHALTPEAVEQVVLLTERDDARDRRAELEHERADVSRRLARLVEPIETGDAVASLVARVRDLEARQAAISAELASLRPVPRLAPDVLADRLAEWRRLLRQSTTQSRAVLQRVLRGRITFTPLAGRDGYTFAAPTRFDKLFSGFAVSPEARPAFLEGTLTGSENLTAEDTGEADYGRLLERAYERVNNGKGVASPTGVVPAWSKHIPGEVPAVGGTEHAA
jgi:hypothetical protein